MCCLFSRWARNFISFVLMQKTIIFAKNLNRYGTGKTKC